MSPSISRIMGFLVSYDLYRPQETYRGSVIKDGIDTGPLLEEHGNGSDNNTPEHGHSLEERCNGDKLQLNGVDPVLLGQMREVCLDSPFLENGLRPDLKKLEFDELVINRHGTEFGQSLPGFLWSVMVDKPPRRERHEDHANEKNQGRRKLQSQRHKPSSVRLTVSSTADVVGTIVDLKIG